MRQREKMARLCVKSGEDMVLPTAVIALGGCPLAEHGVGRNPTKQALLKDLYGDIGLRQCMQSSGDYIPKEN